MKDVEMLCSNTHVDQRFSVVFRVEDRSITTLTVNFSFSGQGKWAIATWALISGTCDSSCSKCAFSNDPTKCIGCNSFFIMGSDSKCSQCYTGFELVTTNSVQSCRKCAIEYQNCNPGQTLCFYNNLPNQLNSTDCTFAKDSGTPSPMQITIVPTTSTACSFQGVCSQ
jgi:hypothetical protein